MATQRERVAMSDVEIEAFFREVKSLQVATLGRDGAPHLTTVWSMPHEGRLLFESYGTSQKVVNLKRDPRVAVIAGDGESYDRMRGVSISGVATVIDREPERTRLMTQLVAHHFPAMPEDQIARTGKDMAQKRVVVAVKPLRTTSWDHRKLNG